MTINELEQGLRNLIATQPMVTAGANGEVVAGINAIIDAYRNLSFRIHTYPCQDIMKFGLSNESAKLENTLSNLVLQVMQERGFNLLLYIPRSAPGAYGPTINQFGMVTSGMDPNMMMGQMMYQNSSMHSMGNPYGNVRGMSSPAYNSLQPQMVGLAAGSPYSKATKTSPSAYPSYDRPPQKPVQIVPATQSEESVKPMASSQAKIKPAPTKKVEVSPVSEDEVDEPEQKPHTPSPAEVLIAGATGGAGLADPHGKAKGRDYLVELLKK